MKRTFRSIDYRPALLYFGLSLGLALGLVLVLFAATSLTRAPLLQDKLVSLHYRILAMMPQPEHPAYVPTPLPTPTALSRSLASTLAPSVTASSTPEETDAPTEAPTEVETQVPTLTRTPTRAVTVKPIQASVQLSGVTNDYQRWNNCGPTTLEMYLSFFGVHIPQLQIAGVLKPNPDDKNVRPDEMVAYAHTLGFDTLVRVNGNLDRIKLFLSNGMPLIAETGFDPPRAHQGWMGHYRLITGYDAKSFITQDSYDGPNVAVEFSALDADWLAFNRTYLLIYPHAQAPLVRSILGDDWNDAKMEAAAAAHAQQELDANPKNAFAAFNLGSSLLALGRDDQAAAAFDQARLLGLPWRMLWYQFGPYEAYYRVGRYDEVIALANATLKPDPGLEESHYYKGLALEKLGRLAEARAEFALAVSFNKNYTDAQRELAQLAQP